MQQIAKLLDMNISSASPTPGLPVPLLGAPGSMTEVPGGHRLLSRSGSGSTSSDSSHLPRGDGGPAGGTGVTGRSSTHRSRLATEYAFYEAQPVFGYGKLHEQQQRYNHHQQDCSLRGFLSGRRPRTLSPNESINKIT